MLCYLRKVWGTSIGVAMPQTTPPSRIKHLDHMSSLPRDVYPRSLMVKELRTTSAVFSVYVIPRFLGVYIVHAALL
jgi:hypothetical protein